MRFCGSIICRITGELSLFDDRFFFRDVLTTNNDMLWNLIVGRASQLMMGSPLNRE